ncbi:hypothetical protein, partial [Erwinia endophytica]|uniref:hypothetical protein n=1 Tax=Erwinia endophytica TaxID=1563158 RepID=UPI001958E7BF
SLNRYSVSVEAHYRGFLTTDKCFLKINCRQLLFSSEEEKSTDSRTCLQQKRIPNPFQALKIQPKTPKTTSLAVFLDKTGPQRPSFTL